MWDASSGSPLTRSSAEFPRFMKAALARRVGAPVNRPGIRATSSIRSAFECTARARRRSELRCLTSRRDHECPRAARTPTTPSSVAARHGKITVPSSREVRHDRNGLFVRHVLHPRADTRRARRHAYSDSRRSWRRRADCPLPKVGVIACSEPSDITATAWSVRLVPTSRASLASSIRIRVTVGLALGATERRCDWCRRTRS